MNAYTKEQVGSFTVWAKRAKGPNWPYKVIYRNHRQPRYLKVR